LDINEQTTITRCLTAASFHLKLAVFLLSFNVKEASLTLILITKPFHITFFINQAGLTWSFT